MSQLHSLDCHFKDPQKYPPKYLFWQEKHGGIVVEIWVFLICHPSQDFGLWHHFVCSREMDRRLLTICRGESASLVCTKWCHSPASWLEWQIRKTQISTTGILLQNRKVRSYKAKKFIQLEMMWNLWDPKYTLDCLCIFISIDP